MTSPTLPPTTNEAFFPTGNEFLSSKKAGKTPELYNELEKLEDFFRQEAVFMAKAWIEVFGGMTF